MNQVKNLISLVANAVATKTQDEAIDYLEESTIYNSDLVSHCVTVLIKTKQAK